MGRGLLQAKTDQRGGGGGGGGGGEEEEEEEGDEDGREKTRSQAQVPSPT